MPAGLLVAVIAALLPEHIVGLFTVTDGGVTTVTVPIAKVLGHDGVPVVDTITEYVPAAVAVKLETFPGFITPDGTVHA